MLLLDPMLATGGSAIKAIDVLIEKGVPAEQIVFLNMFASPEGALIREKDTDPPKRADFCLRHLRHEESAPFC